MYKINNYYYDLFIRFSNFSIITLFYFNINNVYNINIYKNNKYLFKLKNELPIFNNIHLNEFILFSRKIHITIGQKKNFLNFYSFLGNNNNLIINFNKKNFFTKINYFLFLFKYNLNNNINNFFKNIYLFRNFSFNNNYLNSSFLNKIIFKNDINSNYSKILINQIFFNYNKKNYMPQLNLKNRLIYFIRIKRIYYNFFYNINKKKISNIIYNLRQKNISKKLYYHEFNIENIIKNIYMLSPSDIIWLKKNNCIYYNGYVCYNLKKNIKKNDRIQLKIHNDIFLLQRFNFNILIKKYYKILNYYKYYHNYNSSTKLNFNKKIFLNWLNNFYDIYKFIENDYIILTLFILYNPSNKIDYNFYNIYYKNIFRLNLLNWKILY